MNSSEQSVMEVTELCENEVESELERGLSSTTTTTLTTKTCETEATSETSEFDSLLSRRHVPKPSELSPRRKTVRNYLLVVNTEAVVLVEVIKSCR